MRQRRSELRWWFSGRILACHAADRGSIPRQRKNNVFEKKNYCDGMLMQLQMYVLDSFYTILIPCGLVVSSSSSITLFIHADPVNRS